jgi:hypothetical protein
MTLHQLQGICSVGCSCNPVITFFQEKDIGFQKIDLIICP